MAPRPASPRRDSVCGREPSVSPPTVVAPVAVKPTTSMSEGIASAAAVPTDQQRLLYQLALAERLRLASAGLAWARPPITTQYHHHLQDVSVGGPLVGGLMSSHLLGGLGSPLVGGLSTSGFPGGLLGGGSSSHPSAYPPPHPALYGYPRALLDPRALLPRGPEEPKPQHSYIGLIALAILSSPDTKLVLSDIYQYILDHYSYFRSRGPGWRNSIRHNLSLNDCFVKAGRSANGKGHYWAIHPANIDDFRRGDFRRRRAQRRVRKHLGLAVDDDSDPESLSPPPVHASLSTPTRTVNTATQACTSTTATTPDITVPLARPKRQFDVLSLLAPDLPSHHPDGGHHIPTTHTSPSLDQATQRRHEQLQHLQCNLQQLPLPITKEEDNIEMKEEDLQVKEEPVLQIFEDDHLQIKEPRIQVYEDDFLHVQEPCLQVYKEDPTQVKESNLQSYEEYVQIKEEPRLHMQKILQVCHAPIIAESQRDYNEEALAPSCSSARHQQPQRDEDRQTLLHLDQKPPAELQTECWPPSSIHNAPHQQCVTSDGHSFFTVHGTKPDKMSVSCSTTTTSIHHTRHTPTPTTLSTPT